jgi:hypothetical protein
MPSRVAESILNSEMNIYGKSIAEKKDLKKYHSEIDNLPFLAIETDGNLFPQIIQSKIEIFILQTERLHNKLKQIHISNRRKYKEEFQNKITDYYKSKYEEKYSKRFNDENQVASGMEY